MNRDSGAFVLDDNTSWVALRAAKMKENYPFRNISIFEKICCTSISQGL
jgi:hypothetical protein